MRIRPSIWFLATAALAFLPSMAIAHLAGPNSRAIESASGEYVLLLLTPAKYRAEHPDEYDYDPDADSSLSNEQRRVVKEQMATELSLEEKYPQSGLYRNDGSTELLWPISYIGVCRDVLVADDGVHLITMKMDVNCTDDTDTNPSVTSLDFYASGKLAATYDDWSFLPFFGARILLVEWFNIHLPRPHDYRAELKGTTFTVQIDQRDTLAFDIATGKRIRCRSPWPYYFGVPIVAVPLGLWLSRRQLHGDAGALVGPRGALRFSVRDMLGWMAILAASITAVKFGGWVGGVCSIIAVIGAGVARLRGGTARAIGVGALVACYGAHLAFLATTVADSAFFDDYQLLRLWTDDGWGRPIPLTAVAVAAMAGGWVGGRLCSPATHAVAAPLP